MPTRKRYFRKALWIEVALILILVIPVVVWASGVSKGGPGGMGFVATEPAALTFLGSTLIFLGFVIRRLKS